MEYAIGDLIKLRPHWYGLTEKLGIILKRQNMVTRLPASQPFKILVGYLIQWSDGQMTWCTSDEIELISKTEMSFEDE